MKIDKKLNELPLTKTNPSSLKSLFGETELQAMWVADSEFEIAHLIQKALIGEELRKSNSEIKLIKPEGTYQVWLELRAIFSNTKEMLRDITKNSKIAFNAGDWFGREGALFMRMSIATPEERVEKAIRKVIKAMNEN